MSVYSEYQTLKKKKKEDEKKKPAEIESSVVSEYKRYKAEKEKKEIAPVGFQSTGVFDTLEFKGNDRIVGGGDIAPTEKWYEGWFQKGAASDGANAENVSKTILGTLADFGEDLLTGVVGLGEKAVDAFTMLSANSLQAPVANPYSGAGMNTNLAKRNQEIAEEAKKEAAEFVAKDLYDEGKVARQIISNAVAYNTVTQKGMMATADDLKQAQKLQEEYLDYLETDMEKDSALGRKTDSVVQSAGQLAVTTAASAVGVPWWLVSGVSAFGSEAEEAFRNGASYDEAYTSAAISAGAEVLTEKISGGIKFGKMGTLDDAMTKTLARSISNKYVRTGLKLGMDFAGEGAEEWITEDLANFGKWLTYQDEKTLKEMLFSEEAMNAKIEAFIGGAALGGVGGVSQAVNAKAEGKDYASGLTANEQKVVDKLYQDALQAKKDGKTDKTKAQLYDEVLERMEKGYISTDTIEEVLGGDSFQAYKKLTDSENALREELKAYQTEYNNLGKKETKTLEDTVRQNELTKLYAEAKAKLDDANTIAERNALKAKLDKEVYELTKGDKLRESFFEVVRSKQKYQADLSQYEGKARDVIKQVMDSELVDNSNQTHEFWDLMANLSARGDTTISVASNEDILKLVKEQHEAEGLEFDESQFEGQLIDGFTDGKRIVLNAETPRALNFVVGHEITHNLEKTKHYSRLQELLIEFAGDDYNARFDQRKGQYANKFAQDERYKSKVDMEVTGDLVGDFLFTNKDFVSHLAKDRNVFQRVWDEIKYFAKIATAGSEQKRQLEQVKREFERAWRESNKATGETKYSVSYTTENRPVAVIESDIFNGKFDELSESERVKIAKKAIKGFRPGIPISGRMISVTGKTAEHFTNSDYSDKLRNHNPELYEDRLNIANNLDDVVYASTDYINEDLQHPRKDNIVQFARGTVLLDIGGNKYEANVLVGYTTMKEMVLYDVQDLTATSFTVKEKKTQPTLAGNESDTRKTVAPSTEANVAEKGTEVKSQFSVSDAQNEKGLDRKSEISFSLSNDTAYADNAIALNQTTKTVAGSVMEDAKALRGRIAARMNDIKDRGLVGLPEDIAGNTYIANSSYDGTEENTTICPRSLASEAFMDAVAENLGRPLTVEEQIYISQDLQKRSLAPECTYCYVATDRKAYRAFLGEYVAQRDAVIKKVQENPNADVSRSGDLYKEFLDGRKDTNPMYSRFKMWVDAYKTGKPMIDASHLANINKLMGDINSEFGAELKPQIVDAMKYAQSASWAKKRVNYVAYNGHILKWKQDRINKLNSHYGLRMYSFSDFHPAFVLENMQMITDASVRGLKMLGYTKDTDFVEIFAPSGMNINVSTFGFETGGNVYENNIIGAAWEKAKALREQYPNVGVTFVATNDTLVNWALQQDWIDVVIPYHLVRTGAEVAKAFGYTNYTSESSDTKTKEWAKNDKKYIAPTEHNNDKATYLAALEKNHLKPRFERFIDNPNYMKLVNECRQPASESKPVQPVFNEDAAMVALAKLEANGYYQPVGGSVDRMYEIAAEVAEDMTKQIAPTQHSVSDIGETPKQYGTWNVYAKDMMWKPEEIAPVAENATTVSNMESVAPVMEDRAEESYSNLLEKKADLESRMMAAVGAEDFDTFNQINGEYAEVMARIEDMEQYDQERVDSLDDAEAPPEMEAPYYEREAVELTQKATADIIRNVRASLGLNNMQMADARNIIEQYRTGAIRGRDNLISELQNKFGRYTEKGRDNALAEAQAFMKAIKVYVPDHVKRGIADFNKVRQSNFGKIRFSKEGAGIDQVYQDELMANYPEYFPAEYVTEEDQLLRMIEVANWDVNTETERTLDIGAIEEAADAIIGGVTEFRRNQDLYLSTRDARTGFESLLREADKYAPAEDIAPVKDTQKPAEKPAEKTTRKVLHESIVNDVKARFTEKGFDFDRVLKKAKNLSTFSTVDNTPQRVMEKALGYKEGGILADITVNQVAQNETEGIKWLNSFTGKDGLLRQISRQYGIKPGSKESAAAQMYAEGFYVDDANEIVQYGNAELAADFPDESVRTNIKRLAADPRIRKIYDDTLAMINESRTRNAYPEIPRLDNYFLHFRAMEDTFSKLGLPFNPNDIRAKDLPTDLNGVTADLKPGQPYFASAMHRKGKRTSFDLLGGLEKYLTSAKNQIYHIDDIQTLRALRNYIADTYGQANGLEGLDALSEEEQQDRIEQVYNSHLSTFAKFLNEEANVLAGKTALIDRGLEGIIGRRGITFLNTVNGQVGKNMVGFNISSSLTNFLPVAQTFAKTNKVDFVKAFGQTVANKVGSIFGRNDGFADSSPVIIRRKGADRFYRTPYQKVGDAGYVLMSAVDDISTELIARTKYNELTRKGMDSQTAHFETDKWVSRLMGDRSLGQQPQLYNSKMLGLITKFQLEVRNQLDSQFYDTIQETKVSNEHIQNELARNTKTAAKVTSTFVQLAVVQHLFGKAFESVAGYNPAFDIIEVLMTAFGWDDDEESEDTALDNIEQGFLALLEDLPYTSTLTGGRIPISSALPIGQFIKGEDEYGNEKSRWETLGEVAPYYVLPGGYGQIKKTSAGLGMFSEDHPIAGSYTDSGNLRFPVEDTLGNRIQAGIFGQWASENARDYFDNERKALNEKQTQEYIELDMPIRDYWDYREGLKEQETLEDKFDYIAGLDVSVEQKNIMINNVVDRKEEVDMENYDDFGSYEEFDWYAKNTEKYEFLQKHGISYKDYKSDDDTKDYYDSAYEWYNNNPKKVTVSEVISNDFMTFYQYKTDISKIDAKNANGETVSGLKKERVKNYINGLDLDYGQKLILYKSYYDSKADKEECVYGIVEYLNNRADVSYQEMVTILEEIGYKVDSQGNISWD